MHSLVEVLVEVPGKCAAAEHAAVRWVGAREIDRLGWAEADVPVVGAVKEPMRR